MANGAFKFKDNSGNVVASLSNSGSNIVISGGTLDLSGMTGLTLGNVTMSGTTQNASTASFAPSYLLSSSFNSYTGTTNAQSRLSSLETITGSVATTGSNIFIGTQTITGSLYISANLVVQGSSSLEDITGSNVYIGTNKINLNTDTPAIRFGGISVFDSGSNFGESGSLFWDSQGNRWLYQHPYSSGAPYKSAILISGPQNSGSLGSEATLTSGKIQKAVGDDHIGDSIITETGGGIGINGNLSISGSLIATGSNILNGTIRTNGLAIGVAATDNVLNVRGENSTYDGTISIGARSSIQHRDGGQTILSIANDYNSDSAKFEIRMKGNTTSDAKFTILGSGDATLSNTLQVNAKLYLKRASTGADTLLQFKNEVGVDRAYINFGGTNEELGFYSGAGGTRNMIIGSDGAMGFNYSTLAVRSFMFRALPDRPLAIEVAESGGVHSLYLRPNSSGRHLITSNYLSGGVYLPLSLSGRENDADLVLKNGYVGINDTNPTTKLSINGANYIEMATFTTVDNSVIITNNTGVISSFTARYNSNSNVFSPVSNGIQILKAGILHVTVAQDIRSAGTTNYAALYIRKNGTNISENLVTNTNTEWDMINANVAVDVAANDVISFQINAADVLALDTGSWSQYVFLWASR